MSACVKKSLLEASSRKHYATFFADSDIIVVLPSEIKKNNCKLVAA